VTFVEPYLAEMVSNMQHFLDGKAIDVKKAVPRSESYSDIVNYDHNFITNKIFVGGLPVPLDEKELKRVFSTFGAITDIVIIQDKNTKQSRGFGFVEFIVG
jgi:RNA recognition motif-containing protein